MAQSRLNIKDIEKLYKTTYIGTHQVNGLVIDRFGEDSTHNVVFDIFDGIAYCGDYRGEEIVLYYPKLDFIKSATIMRNHIITNLNLEEDTEITPIHILATYHQVYINK
jgi:hypothetical protein